MNPVTNFDTFLDGESVVSQDLVAWVSMGAPQGRGCPTHARACWGILHACCACGLQCVQHAVLALGRAVP